MLLIPEFLDLLRVLQSRNVKDGLGNKLSPLEVDTLYKEITERRSPWRGEWLDADFKVINDSLYINYGHQVNQDGTLVPQVSERLETCVIKNSYVDLLGSANRQGLPTKTSEKRDFYFCYPISDNNSVAGFFANNDWVYLNCYVTPMITYASLGVRAVRE